MNAKIKAVTARLVFVFLGIVIAIAFERGLQTEAASAGSTMAPTVVTQLLDADCPDSFSSAGEAFIKVNEFDTFSVQTPNSLVELTYNDRLFVGSMTGTGVIFELRVDDQPMADGRAQALVHGSEAGERVTGSITAVFDNLSEGDHTVSLWAAAIFGNATTVVNDPGCFRFGSIVIKEYLPFGTTALPLIVNSP